MPATSNEFLHLVRRCGAVDNTLLDTVVDQLGGVKAVPQASEALAAVLVEKGVLTAFQSKLLTTGSMRNLVFGGKYNIIDRIGAGGMGSVYLCEHRLLRRRVAVKILPSRSAKEPGFVERFHREARAAAALDHPNIVRAYDVDCDGKTHFLVMEYVEGANLFSYVDKFGTMSVGQAVSCVCQVARGLQHAHEAGMVHRDIKPGNLLLDCKGTLKILDMGLALFFRGESRSTTRQLDQGYILGTADYLAPEQSINSETVDIRADIYSLGLTFFYLLAGETPYGEGTTAQKLVWHRTRKPKSICDVRPEVAREIDAIIMKMLAKDPAKRFQTPAEVVAALAPWIDAGVVFYKGAIGTAKAGEGNNVEAGSTANCPMTAVEIGKTSAIATPQVGGGRKAAAISLSRKSSGNAVDEVATFASLQAELASSRRNSKTRSEAGAALEEKVLRLVHDLPSLPDTATRTGALANDPNSDLAQFAALIEENVALTAGLLRIANSPAYVSATPAKNVYQAVVRIGAKQCQILLAAVGIRRLFQNVPANTQADCEALWGHGFLTASLCRMLNRRFRLGFEGEEFAAGLLHDLGRILILLADPAAFKSAGSMNFEEKDILDRERTTLGSDHCFLGAWFARHYRLSGPLVQAIEHHHTPEDAEGSRSLVALVFAADEMANHLARKDPIENYDPDFNLGLNLLRESVPSMNRSFRAAEIWEFMETATKNTVKDGSAF